MVIGFLFLGFFLAINLGIVTAMIYMTLIVLFFGLMKWIDFISRWIKYSKTEFIEINGEIMDTYVVTKPHYSSFGGGRGSVMNVKVEAFNCLDILLSSGEQCKVFVGFNSNSYQHYDGEDHIGDHVNLWAQMHDEQHYMKEDLYMSYYRM